MANVAVKETKRKGGGGGGVKRAIRVRRGKTKGSIRTMVVDGYLSEQIPDKRQLGGVHSRQQIVIDRIAVLLQEPLERVAHLRNSEMVKIPQN